MSPALPILCQYLPVFLHLFDNRDVAYPAFFSRSSSLVLLSAEQTKSDDVLTWVVSFAAVICVGLIVGPSISLSLPLTAAHPSATFHSRLSANQSVALQILEGSTFTLAFFALVGRDGEILGQRNDSKFRVLANM